MVRVKNHNLPDLNINVIDNRDIPVSTFFGIDLEDLNSKIVKVFDELSKGENYLNKDGFSFSARMTDKTVQTLVNLYNEFTDREFVFAMWTYIDSRIRIKHLEDAL